MTFSVAPFTKAVAAVSLALLVSACHYQDYNHAVQPDVREGQAYVYGEDSIPRQSKNQYTPKPELEKRTAAIRARMFGEQGAAEAGN